MKTKTEIVSVRLTLEMVEQLEKMATKDPELTVSIVVRNIIRAYLKRGARENKKSF